MDKKIIELLKELDKEYVESPDESNIECQLSILLDDIASKSVNQNEPIDPQILLAILKRLQGGFLYSSQNINYLYRYNWRQRHSCPSHSCNNLTIKIIIGVVIALLCIAILILLFHL